MTPTHAQNSLGANKNLKKSRGFTLIELLTVIAIIGVLASFTAVVIPRALLKSKITQTLATMKNFDNAMNLYYATHSTYPPGYGFIDFQMRDQDPAIIGDNIYYHLKPWTAYVNLFDVPDMLDRFAADTYDTDRDGVINLMEFSPLGTRPSPVDPIQFPTIRYTSDDGNPADPVLFNEVSQQLNPTNNRPFIYVPVNTLQAKAAEKYWIRGDDFFAESWDANDNELRNVFFPPASYDAYVLISPGPSGNTFGLLDGGGRLDGRIGNETLEEIYHVRALRAYFLATRDLNDNKVPDFEYRARTEQGEGDLEFTVNSQSVRNQLPGTEFPEGAGPLIYRSQ